MENDAWQIISAEATTRDLTTKSSDNTLKIKIKKNNKGTNCQEKTHLTGYQVTVGMDAAPSSANGQLQKGRITRSV